MKITLVLATKDASKVAPYIGQALSISPLFDRVILHSNRYESNVYIPQYKNMTVFFEDTPISCPDAFNKCIGQEEADWILPICDDDFCDFHELSTLIQTIRNGWFDEKDIIYTQYHVGCEKNGWVLTEKVNATFDLLKERNVISFTSFYKRKVWEEIGGYKNMLFNDWLFWLQAAKANKQFVFYEKPFFYFRQGHCSNTSLADTEFKKQPFEVTRKQLLNYVEKN